MSKLIHYSGPAGSILLPSGYTRLAYIESTGTQWVDSGWKPNQNTSAYLQIQITDITKGTDIFGAYTADNRFELYRYNSYLQPGFYKSYNNKKIPIDTKLHTWFFNKNVFKQDGENTITFTSGTFQGQSNIYVGAMSRSAGNQRSFPPQKIYFCRLWNEDTIIRDMVPVQTTSTITSADGTSCPSGSIGLLDLVENKFYQNKGTGTFIAGPEIPQGFPTSKYCQVETHSAVIQTSDVIPCYRRSDGKPGKYTLSTNTFIEVQGTIGPSITFGWGEVVNNVEAEAHPMLGTQYTETNKFTHTGNRKDDIRILRVYQRVEPGQQISISFDTDVTQWASGHNISPETTNKGKWTMWIYFSKVYNPNYDYDSFKCYAASQIKSLGGTRWKYSFTVPADMHMIKMRTNLYSDGSTSYTAHFWNFNWSFGDTGCQVNPLHAIPHNISIGDGRNGEKNGAFDRGHIKTQGLESLKTSNWTIACWLYPLATSPTDGSAFLGLGSTINGALVVESNRYFSYNTSGTARSGNPSLENNKWTHIAFVNNGNTIKYYKNGIYVNEIDSTNIVDTGELWVGSRCFGGEVNCRFQDIQVWDEIKNPAELM